MVAHKHGRPRQERLFSAAVGDLEGHTRGEPHGPFKCPRDSPLAQAPVADGPEEYARKDAVHGADAHHDHARNEEGHEGGQLRELSGKNEGYRAQEDDEDRRGCHGVEEPAHGGWSCGVCSRGRFYAVVGRIRVP